MPPPTINEAWDQYAALLPIRDDSPTSRKILMSLKHAFFSGSLQMYNVVRAVSDEELTVEEFHGLICQCCDELNEFGHQAAVIKAERN